ncbi:drug/metabolite transporter (DMT)-like permease [Anaerosolibacter carboniphilus]|uniref:Drug/metabolite transporter (DMT)-like permease n=1 Tax=Anaerosolibacter carboniphilus TaxID=1417629 RepID=A0A841KWC2_9FIRM|nr:DMT family transporter [Anaerosolibacter carboniphilus]MBB6214475.1 drug/metabolite transporter (DMT)-like permease [Anaerosolibacter carboniphilus]
MDKNRKKAIKYMIIASVLWSIGGLFIKLVDWHPMAIAGGRSGIAAVVMLCYLRKPNVRTKKLTLLGASAYAALLILFVTANKLTTSANAILLQFTAPIWVALFSRWFLKERVQKSDWAAIIAVMLGMVLFFIGDLRTGHMLGNLIAVLSGIAMASMIILLKLQNEGSPVEITLLGNIFTFVIGLPFFFSSIPSWSSLFALLILGIFQLGISYILYTVAIPHVSAIEAILIPVIEPLLNPIWVFWFTRELPGHHALWGGMIVILAITIRSIYQARKDSPSLQQN